MNHRYFLIKTKEVLKKAPKTLAVVLLLMATTVPAQAQRRAIRYLPKYEQEPYHFGFLLAFNEMMFTVKTVENYQNITHPSTLWSDNPNIPYASSVVQSYKIYNVETEQTPGFTVGIIGSKRLGRYFDLRFSPSLSFSERKLIYHIDEIQTITGLKDPLTIKRSIFTTFVEFPWHIKYRSKRYNNIGAYILGGVNPKIDLSSQKKNRLPGTDEIDNLVPQRFDCALELGTGFDVYNQWFKFGIEVKMSYGVLNVVKNEKPKLYTAPIDQLRNKLFQVSFLFE